MYFVQCHHMTVPASPEFRRQAGIIQCHHRKVPADPQIRRAVRMVPGGLYWFLSGALVLPSPLWWQRPTRSGTINPYCGLRATVSCRAKVLTGSHNIGANSRGPTVGAAARNLWLWYPRLMGLRVVAVLCTADTITTRASSAD